MSWTHLAYIESDSEPGKRHEIKKAETGKLGCSCMAYRFMKGAEKTCKHIEAFSYGAESSASLGHTDFRATLAGETFLIHRRAISFGALKP